MGLVRKSIKSRLAARSLSLVLGFAVFMATLPLTVTSARAQGISLIRDAETERMIRDYGNPIFVAAGLEPESIRIYLVNDGAINAFVTVGRRMFINTGLILAANRPNQIIGVIAHETGHIAGGHVARSDAAMASATKPMLITMALGILAAVAGAPQAGIALMMGGQQIAVRNFLAYSRVQESSADQAAVTYLDELGNSSEGLIEFFDKFRGQEVLAAMRQDPYMRTHPVSSDRIRALRSRVAESPYSDVQETDEAKYRLSMVQAKIQGFLDRPEVTFRRYPEGNNSPQALYARSVAHFQLGDVENSLKEILPLIEQEPDNPFFHELHGQMYFETGQAAKALDPYREALRILPEEPLFKLMYGQALLATDEEGTNTQVAREALLHLKEAARMDGDNSFVWHQLAIAYSRLGNTSMADLSTAERYYIGGNASLAFSFATRARRTLPAGSPEWNRANDIIQVAESRAREQRR